MWKRFVIGIQIPRGLVIINRLCACGICNTIEYAKAVCGDNRIADVIGGLHLNSSPQGNTVKWDGQYIRSISPPMMHACHCVDLGAKIALSQAAPLEEVYVGWTKQYT
jgi:7,8-dihydropterin-6-yl-methyl-4-(beta-D-ribofuranosyl)aminobenzene 5'-phosphate synthase